MRGLEPRLSKTGAIIGDRDRKHAPFPYAKPVIWDNFSLFQTKLCHRLRHTCVYAARIFADVMLGKWGSKFAKAFMLLDHNSTRFSRRVLSTSTFGLCG